MENNLEKFEEEMKETSNETLDINIEEMGRFLSNIDIDIILAGSPKESIEASFSFVEEYMKFSNADDISDIIANALHNNEIKTVIGLINTSENLYIPYSDEKIKKKHPEIVGQINASIILISILSISIEEGHYSPLTHSKLHKTMLTIKRDLLNVYLFLNSKYESGRTVIRCLQ